jgi:hypothetical protein
VNPDQHLMSNRRGTAEAPTVSVLLAVPVGWPGGARQLAFSIDSILSQTLQDLELIVIDPGAAFMPGLQDRYDDPRLKHLPINSAAAAWEEGFGEAAGRHIALLEAGDVAYATRLALQSAYLDSHPAISVLGSATRKLMGGIPQPSRAPRTATPAMLAWLLTLGLPPASGSLMLPAQAARDLHGGLGGAGESALDLCLRLSLQGDVARLNDVLTLIADTPSAGTAERIAEILLPLYEGPFAGGAAEASILMARHVSCGERVENPADLQTLDRIFKRLTEPAIARASAADAAAIHQHAGRIWRDDPGQGRNTGQERKTVFHALRTLPYQYRRSTHFVRGGRHGGGVRLEQAVHPRSHLGLRHGRYRARPVGVRPLRIAADLRDRLPSGIAGARVCHAAGDHGT